MFSSLILILTTLNQLRSSKAKTSLRHILKDGSRRLYRSSSGAKIGANFFKVGIPIKLVEDWVAINPTDIKCRGPVQTLSRKPDFSSTGYIYNGDLTLGTETIEIYRKFQSRTSCFTNLFGSLSIERSLQPMEFSVNELKMLLAENYTPKFQAHVSYPAPVCSWLRTVNQVEVLYLKQHQDWPYEYRRNVLKSPYLINGVCKEDFCPTSDRNTIVYRPTGNSHRCDDFIRANVSVYLGNVVVNDGVLNLPFTGSCCIEFCGRKGLLTDYGTFISLETDMANHYCRTECDRDAGLSADLENKIVLNTFVYFEELSRFMNCMQSRDLILLTNKTTSNGIANLVPSFHSKLDFAYRLHNSQLQRAMVQYVPFNRVIENEGRFCVEDKSADSIYCYNPITFIFDRVGSVDQAHQIVDSRNRFELVNGLDLDSQGRVVVPHSWQRLPAKEAFGNFVNIKYVEHDRFPPDSNWNSTDQAQANHGSSIINTNTRMWVQWNELEKFWKKWLMPPLSIAFLIGFGVLLTKCFMRSTKRTSKKHDTDLLLPIIVTC